MISIKKNKDIIVKAFVVSMCIIFAIIYFNNQIIHQTVNLILISFVFAYILKPLRNILSKKFKLNNRRATLIIISSIIVAVLIILYIIIPIMYRELSNLEIIIERFVDFYEGIEEKANLKESAWLSFGYLQIKERLSEFFVSTSLWLVDNAMKISENIISFAVIPVITYYFLSDSKNITKKFYLLMPLKKRGIIRTIVGDIDRLLGSYILGQVILSFIVSLITLVFLVIFNVKFPIWLSVLNGVFNIIPYFGPILGAIPILIVAFLDSTSKGIYVFFAISLIQQIEGNILAPRITSESTDIHPIVVIILLILGERFAGFTGMIIAIPVGVIIKVIYEDINYYLF